MRKLNILVTLFISSVTLINAQTNLIADEGNTWNVLYFGFTYGVDEHGMPIEQIWEVNTEQYVIIGDVVYNGITYKHVFKTDMSTGELTPTALIRQESQKVYILGETAEKVLYDFTLENGDMTDLACGYWNNLYANVDYVNINGTDRKRIQLTPEYGANPSYYTIDTWLEGVGSLYDFIYCGPISGGERYLLCMSYNDSIIYQNPLFQKCYYSGGIDSEDVQEIADLLGYQVYSTGLEQTQNINISVKISDDKITVDFPTNETSLQVDIFNLSGQKVYSEKLNINKNEIEVGFLSNGLYFIKIQGSNGQINNFKILKK
ncbi:MAG: T9SS type A sorting domain-containing protein [Paludibacter sp.]|nr:T9SS type A sorting domain-containing protein [Paludibacter sp.]